MHLVGDLIEITSNLISAEPGGGGRVGESNLMRTLKKNGVNQKKCSTEITTITRQPDYEKSLDSKNF